MKRIPALSVVFAMLLVPVASVYAEDLLTIYQQAVQTSPTLKNNHDTWQGAVAKSGATRASLLPKITLSGTVTETKISPSNMDTFNNTSYTAALSQTLFSLPTWMSFLSDRDLADSAGTTYDYQQQTFMGDLANAYFSVLQAKDTLVYDQANINYLQKFLNQAREKYKVGLKTQKDVEQALSDLYTAKAKYIADKNGYNSDSTLPPSLNSAIESLWQLSGKKYTHLASLKTDFPFKNPEPANIDYWVNEAKRKNLNLNAARQTADAYHALARKNAFAWVPSISLTGTYSDTRYSNLLAAANVDINGMGFPGKKSWHSAVVALTCTWNIFSGGSMFASAFQAASNYQSKLASQRSTYLSTLNAVRQDYLTLIKDVSSVQAYKQAVIAGQASLDQYEAQYQVGTKAIVDVLDQLQQLYKSKHDLTTAKYQYIKDYLQLKLDAGHLSKTDLSYLNSYLT